MSIRLLNSRRALGAATMALALIASTASVLAQDGGLAAAKQAGHVGERPDGLLGVVTGAPAGTEGLVETVNAERLARYRQIAQGNGTGVEAVQAVAGQELIARTPAGQYVFSGGRWTRK